MDKRVYEFAGDLKLSSKVLMDMCSENKISLKSHMSVLNEIQQKKIVELLDQNNIKYEDPYKGQKTSLESIEILGLFGEYDYRFYFNEIINIMVAENGFGKTTILNIIVALLTGNYEKIRDYQFDSIKVKLRNGNTVVVNQDEISKSINDEHILHACKTYLPTKIYRDFIRNYRKDFYLDIEEVYFILKQFMPPREFYKLITINDASDSNKKTNNLHNKLLKIKNSVKQEVIYFPTYRRIEENFTQFSSTMNYMNFGMDDVKKVIDNTMETIKKQTIDDYSSMTGKILDDLLMAKIDLNNMNVKDIDKNKVKIIIGRIGSKNIKMLHKLEEFIQGIYFTENEKFINYFLKNLIEIYEKQQEIEQRVTQFINICNKYLVNKEFRYDPVMAEMKIVNLETKKELDIRGLSSGEKQIIALFCKLYLVVDKNIIFIIDEPELSLSITWQENIIKDIYDSNKISLLIATTHSPFIFENDYFKYTKEMRDYRI